MAKVVYKINRKYIAFYSRLFDQALLNLGASSYWGDFSEKKFMQTYFLDEVAIQYVERRKGILSWFKPIKVTISADTKDEALRIERLIKDRMAIGTLEDKL
jgi:hypothetical protein